MENLKEEHPGAACGGSLLGRPPAKEYVREAFGGTSLALLVNTVSQRIPVTVGNLIFYQTSLSKMIIDLIIFLMKIR